MCILMKSRIITSVEVLTKELNISAAVSISNQSETEQETAE